MTLQNGLIHKGKAYLWTDTLAVDHLGNEMHVSKAMVGLNWPWAGVYSGLMLSADPGRVAGLIGRAIPRNPSELIDACRAALRAEMDEGRHGRLLMAYASRRHGARMFLMGNYSDILQIAPYEVQETVQHACSPADENWNQAFADREFTPLEMRQFIGEQVKRPAAPPHGSFGGAFGGNLIELRISPTGVRPRQIGDIEHTNKRPA